MEGGLIKGKTQMRKCEFGSSRGLQRPISHRQSNGMLQDFLRAEEHILRGISTRAPLPRVLNGICSALDCQIGNVVSLISLPGDDASELAVIARNAEAFGLHIFFSEGIVAESGEALGVLEVYCCVPRSPSSRELQLIERASCLAALAIKFDMETSHQRNFDLSWNRTVRARLLDWPASMN
jgi:hypothetical protein